MGRTLRRSGWLLAAIGLATGVVACDQGTSDPGVLGGGASGGGTPVESPAAGGATGTTGGGAAGDPANANNPGPGGTTPGTTGSTTPGSNPSDPGVGTNPNIDQRT